MSSKHDFHGSSPSSGGAESAAGTPDTRLTPFSSIKSIHDKTTFNLNQIPSDPACFPEKPDVKLAFDFAGQDPFISSSVRSKYDQSLLSPTALAFQPFGLRISQGTPHAPMVVKSPDPFATARISKHPVVSVVNAYAMEAPFSAGSYNSLLTQSGVFSTDSGAATRILQVSSPQNHIQAASVHTCVQNACYQTKGSIAFIRSGNDVMVRFSNIIDATNTYKELKTSHPEWSVVFISPASFAEKTNPELPFVSAHEGQVGLIAIFPTTGDFDRTKLEGIVLDSLGVDGEVFAYQKQLATEAGTFRLVAEYSDVNSAAQAVERLNGKTIRGIKISVAFHKPDVDASTRQDGLPITPTRGHFGCRESTSTISRMSLMNTALSRTTLASTTYASVLSPTGRSYVPTPYAVSPQYASVPIAFSGQYSPLNNPLMGSNLAAAHFNQSYAIDRYGTNKSPQQGFLPQMSSWNGLVSPTPGTHDGQLNRFNGRRPMPPRSNRASYPNSQVVQHNVVDIDRIRGGLDVRTTIMLRNIPNKIDQGQLKLIVDQTSRGLYDFMYLRIDFANNCNVGYAFINFEDPYHIINFVAARAGQRWNRYSSDKIAEVSYATIQGKDCLVQKFRNSSVMLEHPSFRPKIFFTGDDSQAGDEEDFPQPDNASKMRRSVENAEHVGLFAPRAGQHYRDEQRRRRSRYDRGTRLAALEEYDYEEFHSAEQDF